MLKNIFNKKIRLILHIFALLLSFPLFLYPQQDSTIENSFSETEIQDTNDTADQDTIKAEVHPQDISEEAGYIIENIGKWGKLRIYGSVRLSGAYDLNGLTSANSFSTYDIPVGDDAISQPRFFMSPHQTRLGLEVTRSSLIGNFKLKIESDFLGKNNGLRIRHAYVESGNFLIGQTWSTFTDVNSVPATVDIDGPNSSVQLRTVRIRYSNKILETPYKYIVSLESPDPDIILPDSSSDRIPSQFLPDIAGKLTYNYSNGYVSLSTILRGITVKDSAGSSDQIIGSGLLLAGVYDLDEHNKFLFQGVYGRAISRFITALNGKGLDLVLNPVTQSFEATKTFGLLLSYSHKWRADISSAFTTGLVDVINKDFEPPDAFSESWYLSGNIFWNALLGVRLGLEFSHGTRLNKDGESGRATRFGFIFYADF